MRHSESESKDAALPRLEAMPPHVLGVSAGRVAAAITGVLTRLFFVILASSFFPVICSVLKFSASRVSFYWGELPL